MKQLIMVLLLAVIGKIQAQQPFEGTIVYGMESSSKPADTFSLTVKFGKKAIWIKYPKKGPRGADEVLVDLEAGKFFELEMASKGYTERKLFKKENQEQLAPDQIAGHKVKTVDLTNKGISGLFAGMGRSQVMIYSSEDLYYPVPPEYNSNIAVSMIYDNKILLGLTIIDPAPYEGAANDTIHLKAESVTPELFATDAFKIPAGFTVMQSEMPPPPPVAPVEIDTIVEPETAPVVVESPPMPLEPVPPIKMTKKKTTGSAKKKTSTGTKLPARKP